jgi:WD and tetratricopeptide repeat-containing protein 1
VLFLAGHLPVKLPDYNSRLRVLVATYVTFSPNGTELLVNMGGEQVGPLPGETLTHSPCLGR